MKKSKKSDFKVLEWKDKVQAKIYEKVKDMTVDEQVEYYRNAGENGPLADWIKKVKASQEKHNRKKAG